jgi:hypothetical protein
LEAERGAEEPDLGICSAASGGRPCREPTATTFAGFHLVVGLGLLALAAGGMIPMEGLSGSVVSPMGAEGTNAVAVLSSSATIYLLTVVCLASREDVHGSPIGLASALQVQKSSYTFSTTWLMFQQEPLGGENLSWRRKMRARSSAGNSPYPPLFVSKRIVFVTR